MKMIILLFTLFITYTTSRSIKVFDPKYENITILINEESIEYLSQMNSVIPITVIGARKSGKSFLMNQLSQTNSFDLGHHSFPQTKGIDILYKRKYVDDHDIVYFDTEGLSSNPDGFEKNIILFGIMASSHLIINIKSELLFSDITSLSLIAQLAKYYKQQKMKTFSFPRLTWVVENYHKHLSVSEEELLYNHFLKEKENPYNEPIISQYNEIIQVLKELFPVQKLFLMPEPIDDIYQFTNLDHYTSKSLNKKYNDKMNELRKWIEESEPFKLKEQLTGEQYAKYIKNFLGELFKEKISTILPNIVNHFGRSVGKETLSMFNSKMNGLIYPMEEDQLRRMKELYLNECLKYFDKEMKSFDNITQAKELRDETIREITRSFSNFVGFNREDSHKFNKQILEEAMKMTDGKSVSEILSMQQDVIDYYVKYAKGPTTNEYLEILNAQLKRMTSNMSFQLFCSIIASFGMTYFFHRYTKLEFSSSLFLSFIMLFVIFYTLIQCTSNMSPMNIIGTIITSFFTISKIQYIIILISFIVLVIGVLI